MGSERKKIKLSLCLNKHYAMKTYGEVKVQIHSYFTSTLDRDEWSVSRPGRFTPREKPPNTHSKEAGWTPEPILTMRRKVSFSCKESNPYSSIVKPVADCYTD
jgi:hypothetical protein